MIYLDNASTTKPGEAVLKQMNQAAECFGNPSSLHRLGLESEKVIKAAREDIASYLGVESKNLYFTSGGTEANNTAIFGAAYSRKKFGNRVITSKIEHPSVLESFKQLEEEGFDVVFIDCNNDGMIDLEQLEQMLNEQTILVSVMYVNNETGVIQPVDHISSLLKQHAPKALFHSDAVQALGKIACYPKKHGIDLMTVSAHKVHGLKGTGALYAGVHIKPFLYGGGQQNGFRPGTENMVGVACFAEAVRQLKDAQSKYQALYDRMKNKILEHIPNVKINGEKQVTGAILNVSFIGVKAEVLLHTLESKGIYVSTGSACSTHKPQPSHILQAMGCTPAEIGGAIRFSFSDETTVCEIEETVEILIKEVEMLRKYMR